MKQVEQLRADWQHQVEVKKAAALKKSKTAKPSDDDFIVEDPPLDEDGNPMAAGGLFDESEDESDDDGDGAKSDEGSVAVKEKEISTQKDLFGDSDDESDEELLAGPEKKSEDTGSEKKTIREKTKAKSSELFGDSDDDSIDEELLAAGSKERKEIESTTERGDERDELRDAKRPTDEVTKNYVDQPKKKRKIIEE